MSLSQSTHKLFLFITIYIDLASKFLCEFFAFFASKCHSVRGTGTRALEKIHNLHVMMMRERYPLRSGFPEATLRPTLQCQSPRRAHQPADPLLLIRGVDLRREELATRTTSLVRRAVGVHVGGHTV